MDACKRHRVNYFVINVRFGEENNKIVTQTFAVKDTEAHHASEYHQNKTPPIQYTRSYDIFGTGHAEDI
jgi:hypothetical protein